MLGVLKMLRKLIIGSDHAGVELKTQLMQKLGKAYPKVDLQDVGPFSTDSVDFPDYADLVCKRIHSLDLVGETQQGSLLVEMGILICGSGQGMCIRANKYSHIRAANCWNVEVAKLTRAHNNSNVLCLGARLISWDDCFVIVKTFVESPFEGGRHQRRVEKISRPVS